VLILGDQLNAIYASSSALLVQMLLDAEGHEKDAHYQNHYLT